MKFGIILQSDSTDIEWKTKPGEDCESGVESKHALLQITIVISYTIQLFGVAYMKKSHFSQFEKPNVVDLRTKTSSLRMFRKLQQRT